jgi:alpha-beta hydrolase superfamily lysophospholipase
MFLYIIIFIIIIITLRKFIKPLIFYNNKKNLSIIPSYVTEFNINTSNNEIINCWYIKSEKKNNIHILFSHDNKESICSNIDLFEKLMNMDYNIITYDYRGYGKSTGKPTEMNIYTDIETVWNYMTNDLNIQSNNIIIYGKEFGACPSAYLISKLNGNFKASILQNPFYSYQHVIMDMLPKMLGVFALFITEFKTYSYIKYNTRPILLLYHSKNTSFIHSVKLSDCMTDCTHKYMEPINYNIIEFITNNN